VIKFQISIFIAFFIVACEPTNKNQIKKIINKTQNVVEKKIKINEKKLLKNDDNLFYFVGDPYFIEGVEYIPNENYNYSEIGLASFYGKELHNVKTINNDTNKVTELLGRHKTLPLPSIVKITNIENGLSITIKIIDRHDDNASLVQVSRKVAQLLGFYRNKLAKVRVDIVSDASKQWKNVSNSISNPDFNKTVSAAPTDIVSISDIDNLDNKLNTNNKYEQPIQLFSEEIKDVDLFLKIYEFNNHTEINNIITELKILNNYTIQEENSKYNLIIGPINNIQANNLVSSFIMKGYKKTKFILE
tara:strand:- start:11297 stop:12205 length:909 start_codon:yes stop_codon:yes gene_type:complete